MRSVYCVALRGDKFIMVFNPKRAGWEMPGGKEESGESDLEAAKREFLEETGREVHVIGCTDVDGVSVFAGEVGEIIGEGEMECCLFEDLPEPLSFPRVEYLPLILWARRVSNAQSSRDGGTASA